MVTVGDENKASEEVYYIHRSREGVTACHTGSQGK